MPEQIPRVVFDCNVFVQGIANRHSAARQALRLFLADAIELFVSEDVLRELRDVLARPELRRRLPGINDRIVAALFIQLRAKAILISNVPEEYRYDRDPDDECYLNLAIITKAAYLVSRDNDLLDLMTAATEVALRFRNRYPFLRVMKAEDFVEEIAQQRSPT